MRSRVDFAIALAVAIVGQLDVWASDLTGAKVVGARPAVAVFYLVTALALGWRRRAPFVVAMVVVGANVAQALALGASEGQGVLVPALIALYSVGAHEERPRSLLALAGLPLVLLARETNNPDNTDLPHLLDALAWESTIFAAWLLGAYLRTRRLYVAELKERATRAERAREEQARAAVADERGRIARELHDAVAHGVTVMVVQAEAAEEMLGGDPERARQPLQRVQQTGRDALVELRRLLGILRDEEVQAERGPQPGLADLGALITAVEEAGLPVELRVEGAPVALPSGLDLSAYRIVQEALTNTLKHAGPTSATVVLTYGNGVLELEVADEGLGQYSSNGAGHGLAGMRERVALYGGELTSGPRPGRGYLVRARLPVQG
ncbi:MAG: sensor histidine kinase [Actinomycetota bacterium]|nr:sensor histidine kinase [Actinomycetota bacterium]